MPSPTSPDSRPDAAPPERRLERPREGRWLAGVCAALARYSGRGVTAVRLAFVLTIPLFGLPLVAYLVWWLILPEEGGGERTRGAVLFSGLTGILLSFGVGLALLTLAAASVVATVFGLGWGVLVVAGAVLVAGIAWMGEINPGWTLLPLAALVLPAAAITGLDAHLARQIGDHNVAPAVRSELPADGYRLGVGTLFIDLRHYEWADGALPLKISGGVGRTIVALPERRCVAVRVHYDTHAGLLHQIAHGLGLEGSESSEISVFGRSFAAGQGTVAPKVRGKAPTLSLDFDSEGGELFVRDYPDRIKPRYTPGWPGLPYYGVAQNPTYSKAEIRRQQLTNRQIVSQLGGPCADGGRR